VAADGTVSCYANDGPSRDLTVASGWGKNATGSVRAGSRSTGRCQLCPRVRLDQAVLAA
jgi:hypothetical protein